MTLSHSMYDTRRGARAIHRSAYITCNSDVAIQLQPCTEGRPSSSADPDEEGRRVVRLEELKSRQPGQRPKLPSDRPKPDDESCLTRESTGRRSRVHYSEIHSNTGYARLLQKTVRTGRSGIRRRPCKTGPKPPQEQSPEGCA